MPYLAFDLDAKKLVPRVARAAGVEPGAIAWGLLELWEHAWASKTDTVSEMVLDGCMGPSERIRVALEEHGFIERTEAGWRVRGASRYLRISEARAKGGRAAAGNLRRGKQAATGCLPAQADHQPGLNPGSTPSTEHRAPSTEQKKGDATEPRPPPVGPPTPPGQLRERIEGEWRAAKGSPYQWDFASERAVQSVLARAGSEDELVLRWGRAIRRTRYPGCSTLAELGQARVWNANAAEDAATGPPKDARRGVVRAEDVTHTEEGGVYDF